MKPANLKIIHICILCSVAFIFYAQSVQASCCMYDWSIPNQQYYRCDVASQNKNACIEKSKEGGVLNKGLFYFEADKTCSSSVFGSGPYSCAGSNQALNETAATAQTVVETKWTNPFDNFEVKIPGLERLSDPVPCPDDPTKYCVKWLGEYTIGLYQYALGIIGILAAVVVMIGGVIWLLAGGNSAKIGDAKKWINGSIAGVIIALTSYAILYQINPSLTIFNPIKITKIKPGEVPYEAVGDACKNYAVNNVIDYSKVIGKMKLPGCNYNFKISGYSNYEKMLKAIAANESTCNKDIDISPAGACGLMQLLPSTARAYAADPAKVSGKTNSEICTLLRTDPDFSIATAAKYISANSSRHENKLTYMLAGYNSGYGTGTSGSGKVGSLAGSKDCPGRKAFECCINPGELAESQNYVVKAMLYMNGM